MRLVRKDINERDGSGSVTLLPNEPEDMWHLYNLIRPKDILKAPAVRKVTRETGTGSTASNIVRTVLTTRVLRTDFDAAASELHVAGQVCAENEHVPIGAHHTLDLELNRQFTLEKGGDEGWDSVALEMLRDATDVRKSAEVFAVVMQEGLASICVITEYQTLLRQRIEVQIPRKRQGHGADAHEKGLDKFFEVTLETLLRHLDLPAMQADAKFPPLLLASPGFTAQAFHKHMLAYAQTHNEKPLLQYARTSVLLAHSSSGYLHALNEVLKSPAILSKLADTKYARESQVMDRFLQLVREDEGRAWYGPHEVEAAVEKGAVGRGGGILLISNRLFRSHNVAERRRWVALVERVKVVEGGEVRILSSAHESGKKLEGLGSVGAILTFPILDLDEGLEGEDGGLAADEHIPDESALGQSGIWVERGEGAGILGAASRRAEEIMI